MDKQVQRLFCGFLRLAGAALILRPCFAADGNRGLCRGEVPRDRARPAGAQRVRGGGQPGARRRHGRVRAGTALAHEERARWARIQLWLAVHVTPLSLFSLTVD